MRSIQESKYISNTMSILNKMSDDRYDASNELLGESSLVVPFVACGDLNGFDADKSYPLQLADTSEEYA